MKGREGAKKREGCGWLAYIATKSTGAKVNGVEPSEGCVVKRYLRKSAIGCSRLDRQSTDHHPSTRMPVA